MMFNEQLVKDPSQWQAEKMEDDVLREMVEEDETSKSIHMIFKNEKASTGWSEPSLICYNEKKL